MNVSKVCQKNNNEKANSYRPKDTAVQGYICGEVYIKSRLYQVNPHLENGHNLEDHLQSQLNWDFK